MHTRFFNKNDFLDLNRLGENLFKLNLLQKRNDIPADDECGLSVDRVLLKRIIGGNEAKFGQFPWQAHLKIATYQCGGVLGKLNCRNCGIAFWENFNIKQYAIISMRYILKRFEDKDKRFQMTIIISKLARATSFTNCYFSLSTRR